MFCNTFLILFTLIIVAIYVDANALVFSSDEAANEISKTTSNSDINTKISAREGNKVSENKFSAIIANLSKTGKFKYENAKNMLEKGAITIIKLGKYIRSTGFRKIVTKILNVAYRGFRKLFKKPTELANFDEYEENKKNFEERLEMINEHNKAYRKGLVSFAVGLTKFTDWNHRKFAYLMNGLTKSMSIIPKIAARFFNKKSKRIELPKEVDWRGKTYISPVKEQGKLCRACWAFASASIIETYLFKNFNESSQISEQNYIDCAKRNGCNGGHMVEAFDYTVDNKGVNSVESYPYKGYLGRCRFNRDGNIFGSQMTDFERLPPGDEEALKEYVALEGPIAVGIDGSTQLMQDYIGDLFYDPTCSSEDINHAAIVVGYGTTENGEDYWLLKNSWGNKWGEEGYLKLARNRNNHCGITKTAVYPVFK